MIAKTDSTLLEMALIGYLAERQKIDNAMAGIRKQLGQRSTVAEATVVDGAASKRKRKMSAAGRKRIAEAQRERWAAFHAKVGRAQKKMTTLRKTVPKRKLSAGAKAKLVANLAKARAARATKAAAA
jgi:G:T/U-mismatch repair DNA glycosylase